MAKEKEKRKMPSILAVMQQSDVIWHTTLVRECSFASHLTTTNTPCFTTWIIPFHCNYFGGGGEGERGDKLQSRRKKEKPLHRWESSRETLPMDCIGLGRQPLSTETVEVRQGSTSPWQSISGGKALLKHSQGHSSRKYTCMMLSPKYMQLNILDSKDLECGL